MSAHQDHAPDLGQPNGIATLDAGGQVPSAQLPTPGAVEFDKILVSRNTGHVLTSRNTGNVLVSSN